MTSFIERFGRYCGSATLAWLMLVNAGVFVLLWVVILAGNAMGIDGNFTMQWLCVSSDPSNVPSRFWTVATYMFTHYGILHLLFNMLWLMWFGRLLLTTLSDRHLIWLYVGGGLCGALLYISGQAVWPQGAGGSSYLCGASAAVLSVMVASAMRTPNLRLSLLLFGEVRLKWIALVCIILTFTGVGGGNVGGQAAHIGGLIFGASLVLALRQGHDVTKSLSRLNRGAKAERIPRSVRRVRKRDDVRRDGDAVAKAAAGRLGDPARLDELLDKIRLSGYQSLTASERRELNALSQRLRGE